MSKQKWSWGDWKQAPPVPAALVGKLVEKSEGLTAKELVEYARPPRSPYHPIIPKRLWSDRTAAEVARVQAARNVLNHLVCIIVIANEQPRTVRALVALPGSGKDGSGRRYTPLELAVTQYPLSWQAALRELRRDIRALQARYAAWKQLAPILEHLGRVVK